MSTRVYVTSAVVVGCVTGFVHDAAAQAIELAAGWGMRPEGAILFAFNGTYVPIEADDTPTTLVRRWARARSEESWPDIGGNPS